MGVVMESLCCIVYKVYVVWCFKEYLLCMVWFYKFCYVFYFLGFWGVRGCKVRVWLVELYYYECSCDGVCCV